MVFVLVVVSIVLLWFIVMLCCLLVKCIMVSVMFIGFGVWC